MENIGTQYKPYLITHKDNKKYLLAYSSSKMMNELDNVLLWRGSQFNPLFDMKFSFKKKKKKNNLREKSTLYTFLQKIIICLKMVSNIY